MSGTMGINGCQWVTGLQLAINRWMLLWDKLVLVGQLPLFSLMLLYIADDVRYYYWFNGNMGINTKRLNMIIRRACVCMCE